MPVRYVVEFLAALLASSLVAYGPRLISRLTALLGTLIGIFVAGLLLGAAAFTLLWGGILYAAYVRGTVPEYLHPLRLVSEVINRVSQSSEGGGVMNGASQNREDPAGAMERYDDAVTLFEESLAEIRSLTSTIEDETTVDTSPLRDAIDRARGRLVALDTVVGELDEVDSKQQDNSSWQDRTAVAIDDVSDAVQSVTEMGGKTFQGELSEVDTENPIGEEVQQEWEAARFELVEARARLETEARAVLRDMVNESVDALDEPADSSSTSASPEPADAVDRSTEVFVEPPDAIDESVDIFDESEDAVDRSAEVFPADAADETAGKQSDKSGGARGQVMSPKHPSMPESLPRWFTSKYVEYARTAVILLVTVVGAGLASVLYGTTPATIAAGTVSFLIGLAVRHRFSGLATLSLPE